jgi:hypothetical protein
MMMISRGMVLLWTAPKTMVLPRMMELWTRVPQYVLYILMLKLSCALCLIQIIVIVVLWRLVGPWHKWLGWAAPAIGYRR